jgi:hypothetical protein
MKKHIHCFISESKQLEGAVNVDINEMKNVANGSCDYLSFSELNSVPLVNVEPVVGALSKKIKLETGRLLIEFLNFDRIVNDIIHSKLDIDKLNDLLSEKTSFLYEEMFIKILEKNNIKIEHIIYEHYNIKVSVLRNE